MSVWRDQLESQESNTEHGASVKAVTSAVGDLSIDVSASLNAKEALPQLRSKFESILDETVKARSGLDTLESSQRTGDRETWLNDTSAKLAISKPTLDLILTAALSSKGFSEDLTPDEWTTALSEMETTAEDGVQAIGRLETLGVFEDEPERTGEDGPSVATASEGLIDRKSLLRAFAAKESESNEIHSVMAIIRTMEHVETISLEDVNAAIDKANLNAVFANKLVYTPRVFAYQSDGVRTALKKTAAKMFSTVGIGVTSPDLPDEQQDEGVAGVEDGKQKRSIERFQKGAVFIILFAALALLASVFTSDSDLLQEFSIDNNARGFITLSFVVGAITIFLIITTVVVFETRSFPKDVYERAKTILSMLLGILGTVIGFYFGTSESEEDGAQTEFSVEIREPDMRLVAARNYKLSIAAVSDGGQGDVTYTVLIFGEDEKSPLHTSSYVSSSGLLTEEIDIRTQKDEDVFDLRLVASDEENTTIIAEETLEPSDP